MKITAFFSRVLSWLTGKKQTVDNSVVRELELNRFLGTWYEVARFNHFFERGIEQTKANYELRDDGGINVTNTGIKNGKPMTAIGRGKLTDLQSLFRVSFFGPFYSDYRVMLIDDDYQYALVGSGSDNYLWILSRTPNLTDDIKSVIIGEAKRRGYDTEKLIWVKQE